MGRPPGRFLRWFASLLVRGPGAPFVLGDLEEGMRRDTERGMSLPRARLRFVVNALRSGLSLARDRLPRPPAPGPSWIDVKLGWRMLWKNPVLTSVAVLSLAVGIPVGMAPVHVMDAIDAPPPVEDGDRLMGLRYRSMGQGGAPTTSYDLGVWQEALGSFEALGAMRESERNLTSGGGVGAPVDAAEVTASTFSMLRVRPLLGRALHATDEVPGAEDVVVLGYDVWQSRLAADPEVVGSTVRIAGVPHTVVGVMPEGFLFPRHQGMWLPLRDRPASEPGRGARIAVFGRLAEGATAETAQNELTTTHGGMAVRFPEPYGRVRAEVVSLTTLLNGFPKGGMGAIAGLGPLSAVSVFQALAFVLLMVACANVGLLIFARTATRSSELTVRTALGASRTRIVGQVATEALVLAVLAAGVGLLLVHWLPDRLLAAMWSPDWGGIPWWIDLGVTPTTVMRALSLAAFSAVVAAVVPALRVTGKAVQRNIQRAGTGGYGIRFGGVWSALVVADVALAVAAVGLTAGIGARMQPVASGEVLEGLAAEEYLAVRVELPGASSASSASDSSDAAAWTERLAATQGRLVERLRAEPGVRNVAVAERLPRMDHGSRRIEVEGGPTEGVERARVDPDFFDALGAPVLAGRRFHGGDLEGDRSAVIVNATFAETMLEGRNPLGHRIRSLSWADGEPGPWHEIVGMVGDLGMDPLQPENAAGVYHPAAPGELHPLHLAVHVGASPASFAPRVRELAAEVDPAAMVVRAIPLDEVYPEDWYLLIGLVIGWSLFVAVLLALAASGVYAIMAFAVAQRTREIGVRTALGAGAADIVRAIGRRAAVQLGTGALFGMPVAGWIYYRIREGWGDPTATLDAFLVAVIPGIGIVLLVGLLACVVPLRRALRVMPTEAMRGVG